MARLAGDQYSPWCDEELLDQLFSSSPFVLPQAEIGEHMVINGSMHLYSNTRAIPKMCESCWALNEAEDKKSKKAVAHKLAFLESSVCLKVKDADPFMEIAVPPKPFHLPTSPSAGLWPTGHWPDNYNRALGKK